MSTQIVGVDEKNLRAYLRPMSPEQSRAARAWLDWSQQELAAKASVSLSTVRDFEKGRRIPIANNLTAMRAALEAAGIAFVDGVAPGITYSKKKRR
jgi:DNA-binding transcriptional regulator YiaG